MAGLGSSKYKIGIELNLFSNDFGKKMQKITSDLNKNL